MKQKMKKVVNYIKEHKTEIIVGSGVTILGGICAHKIYKADKGTKCIKTNNILKVEHITDVDLGVGKVEDIIRFPEGAIEFWVDNVDIKDVGKLGESMMTNVPDVTADSELWMLTVVKPKTN